MDAKQYVVTVPLIVEAKTPMQANGRVGFLMQKLIRENDCVLSFERIQAPIPLPLELYVQKGEPS